MFLPDDEDCPACDEALRSLEDIDDEIDELDIIFVKIKDARYAFRYGVKNLPALTYFRKRFPTVYHGEFYLFTEVITKRVLSVASAVEIKNNVFTMDLFAREEALKNMEGKKKIYIYI